MTRRHPSITSKLAPAVLIAVLLAVWQLCSDLGVVPKFMLPSPTDVVTAFVEDFPALMTHARVSLSEAFLGLGTAVILSFVVAFLMDQFRVVREAVYPLLILTGMHSTLAPVCISYFTKFQYDPLIIPACYIANFGQAAAAAAVTLKSKNADVKGIAGSSALTAFLAGVTEPALFGVNVRLRKPLIATTIGGGLGGLYAGLTGVRRFGGGGAGLAAIGLYVGENPMNVINALISAAIAFVATFAILWFIGFDDVPEEA